MEDPAAGRVAPGYEIKIGGPAPGGLDHTVVEGRDLFRNAAGIDDEMSEPTAVSVLDGRQQPARGVIAPQLDLSDPGKILAENVTVLFAWRTQLVIPDLLEEIHVRRGP